MIRFYQDLIIATVGSLIGSVIGAIAGAWLAWHFSRRLFQDEAKARDKSERAARQFERRLAEANVVEDWLKALMQDFPSLLATHSQLEKAIRDGVGLDPEDWPIHLQASPTMAPVIIGPLKKPFGEMSLSLWHLHDIIGRNVWAHRGGKAIALHEVTPASKKVLERREILEDSIRAELTWLYGGDE
jgi:hypothetical protein